MTPVEPGKQDAASEYRSNGQKKVFTLAPVEDDLTFTILNVRRQVLENRELHNGAKVLFVYVLDKSLNRNLNSQPGVVTMSQTKLAEMLGCKKRTIFSWKQALVDRGYIWMSLRPMPNFWPIDTYHITAIHPQKNWEEKTTTEGIWGNGERRLLSDPGLGARESLRGKELPRRVKTPKTGKTPENATESRTELPLSVARICGGEPQEFAAESRKKLRRGAARICGGEPQEFATGSRKKLRRGAAQNCSHREVEVRGLSISEGEGGTPTPPDQVFKTWLKELETMFGSRLRSLKVDLKRKLESARSDEAKKEWRRRLIAVDERLLGGKVPDTPKPKKPLLEKREKPKKPEDPALIAKLKKDLRAAVGMKEQL